MHRYAKINNPAMNGGVCCFGKVGRASSGGEKSDFVSGFNTFFTALKLPREAGSWVLNPSHTITILLLAVVFIPVACTSAPQFSDVINRDWNLVAIRTGPERTTLERSKPEEKGFGEIFTLRFDAERVNGTGAPNRYFAPYTLDKQGITIKTVSSTLMASFYEPEELKEYDFFSYLQNTNKWNLTGKGELELYSKGQDGTETILVFAPAIKK